MVIFDHTHNLISVAARNPNDPITIQILESIQNDRQNINLYMCSTDSLEHAWKRYKDLVSTSASKKGVFDINTDDIAKIMQEKLISPLLKI